MNIIHQKTLRRLAVRSLSVILLYVVSSYVFAVGMLFLAKISSKYVPVLYTVGVVVFAITLLLCLVFLKSLTKKALLDRMMMLSEKAQEKDEQIMAVLKEDLADAVTNWNKLALGRPRGNYKERYALRDQRLAELYLQSAKYNQQEIELWPLLDYLSNPDDIA